MSSEAMSDWVLVFIAQLVVGFCVGLCLVWLFKGKVKKR